MILASLRRRLALLICPELKGPQPGDGYFTFEVNEATSSAPNIEYRRTG